MNGILLNFGASKEGQELCDSIKEYASGLGVPQKTLLLMALYDWAIDNREIELAKTIGVYQAYDGRRK